VYSTTFVSGRWEVGAFQGGQERTSSWERRENVIISAEALNFHRVSAYKGKKEGERRFLLRRKGKGVGFFARCRGIIK